MNICINVRYYLVLFIMLSCVSLAAYTEELDSIYSKLSENYNKINSYEAAFTQENYWKEIDTSKQSEGKIYYNDSSLLLEYSEPAGQKMLVTEDSVTIFDAAANQALITSKVDTELRPMAFISLYWDNSNKEILEKEAGNYKLKLITAGQEEIIISIRNNLITEMKFTDDTGNSVTYTFTEEYINKPLPKNLFELSLPADANVIDYRQ